MSSFDDFLKERRIFDTYDSFSKEDKLEWNKIFQEEKSRASTAPAGKFTFQSHFSPAIKFEYIYNILFDMLSLFSRALPSRSRPQAELLFLL
jgi:hypothetical protein